MSKRRSGHGHAVCAALVALLVAAGCVPPETDTGAGGSGGAGSGGAGSGGGTTTGLSGTDAQVCGTACQTLIACGAELQQDGCKESCVNPASSGLVNCLRQVTTACNELALCVWGTVCGPPGGGASCGEGQNCLISCAGNPAPGCGCSCVVQVDASLAINLYNLATCASARCSAECATTGDPASCQGCMANECATADGQCN